MMKKNYLKPNTQVITLTPYRLICQSTTTPIAGEEDTPPGGWEPANGRQYSDFDFWSDEDEEDY